MKSLEKPLKKLSLNIVGPFFKGKRTKSEKPEWQKFKKILIFRLDNRLGNAILLLPLIQSVKKSLPDSEIDVMYSSNYGQIFEKHPDIHLFIPYDQSYLLKNPLRYLPLIIKMRHNQYDVVLSSTNSNSFSVSQSIFAGLLGAKYTVGFDWKESNKIYTAVVTGNTNIHYAAAQVDLWKYFDQNATVQNPRLFFIEDESRQYDNADVLFWLGATSNKILPEKLIKEIISELNEKNIKFKFAAGPSDESLIENYPVIWRNNTIIRKGSLKDTSRFFRQYKLIIIPDTGPMHLAVALGIPTVQVFVKSDPTWYAYTGENCFLINKSLDKQKFCDFLGKYL